MVIAFFANRPRKDTKSRVRYRAQSESQPYGQSVNFLHAPL